MKRLVVVAIGAAMLSLTGCGPSADEIMQQARLEAANTRACASALVTVTQIEDYMNSSHIGATVGYTDFADQLSSAADAANGEVGSIIRTAADSFTDWVRAGANLRDGIPLKLDLDMAKLKGRCDPNSD